MPIYDRIQLTADERADLDGLMGIWRAQGSGGDIVSNILGDEWIREAPMKDFLSAFLLKAKDVLRTWGLPSDTCRKPDVLKGLPDAFWAQIETEFKRLCEDGAYVLKGQDLRVHPLPILLGTSYPRSAFESRLRDDFHIKNAPRFVDWLLNESRVPVAEKPAFYFRKNRICITRYAAFATWATSSDPDPFWFADGEWRRYKIHVELGLSPLRVSRKTLLFVYSIPSTLHLLFPTVTDGAVFQFFRVARRTDDHGFTRPWERQWIHKGSNQSDFKRHMKPLITTTLDNNYAGNPRPETVHEKLALAQLVKVTEV